MSEVKKIGFAGCKVCGARVEYRENRAGKLYYDCKGDHDANGKACGSRLTMGNTHSNNMKQKIQAAETAKNNDNNKAENDNERQRVAGTGTDGSFLGGFFD